MLEQVTHGDLGRSDRIGDTEARQVALHRRIQLDLPRLNQLITASAVNGLLTEARSKGVCGVTARPLWSALPNPCRSMIWSPSTRPHATPGSTMPLHLFAHERVDCPVSAADAAPRQLWPGWATLLAGAPPTRPRSRAPQSEPME